MILTVLKKKEQCFLLGHYQSIDDLFVKKTTFPNLRKAPFRYKEPSGIREGVIKKVSKAKSELSKLLEFPDGCLKPEA